MGVRGRICFTGPSPTRFRVWAGEGGCPLCLLPPPWPRSPCNSSRRGDPRGPAHLPGLGPPPGGVPGFGVSPAGAGRPGPDPGWTAGTKQARGGQGWGSHDSQQVATVCQSSQNNRSQDTSNRTAHTSLPVRTQGLCFPRADPWGHHPGLQERPAGRPLSHHRQKEAEGDRRRLPRSPPAPQVSSRQCQSEGSAGDRGQEGRLAEGAERGGLPGMLSTLGSPAPLRTRAPMTDCLLHLGRTLLTSLPFQRPPPTL